MFQEEAEGRREMSWRVSQKRVVIWGKMMSTAGWGRDHMRRRPTSMASRAAKHTHHQTWGTRGGGGRRGQAKPEVGWSEWRGRYREERVEAA